MADLDDFNSELFYFEGGWCRFRMKWGFLPFRWILVDFWWIFTHFRHILALLRHFHVVFELSASTLTFCCPFSTLLLPRAESPEPAKEIPNKTTYFVDILFYSDCIWFVTVEVEHIRIVVALCWLLIYFQLMEKKGSNLEYIYSYNNKIVLITQKQIVIKLLFLWFFVCFTIWLTLNTWKKSILAGQWSYTSFTMSVCHLCARLNLFWLIDWWCSLAVLFLQFDFHSFEHITFFLLFFFRQLHL